MSREVVKINRLTRTKNAAQIAKNECPVVTRQKNRITNGTRRIRDNIGNGGTLDLTWGPKNTQLIVAQSDRGIRRNTNPTKTAQHQDIPVFPNR